MQIYDAVNYSWKTKMSTRNMSVAIRFQVTQKVHAAQLIHRF